MIAGFPDRSRDFGITQIDLDVCFIAILELFDGSIELQIAPISGLQSKP